MIDVDALKAKVDLVSLVGRYTALKRRGKECVGRCVAHSPDEHPSMYVVPDRGFVYCHSCGFSADAIDFVRHVEGVDFTKACEILGANGEWKPSQVPQEAKPLPERITSKPPRGLGTPNMTIGHLGDPVNVWTYRDGQGDVLGYVARYETADGKSIRAWTYGARGDQPPAFGCGQWTRPNRPLYGLDRLDARTVLLLEGEKTADAAHALLGAHYAALTWPGGAQAWRHTDLDPLRGRSVLLWPDADKPGREAMQGLAAVLADPKGLGCKVRIVDPTDKPEGYDLADAQAEGMSTADVIAYAKARVRQYVHVAQQQQSEQSECRDSDTTDTTDTENPAPPPVSGPSSPDSGPPPQAAVAGPDGHAQNAQEGAGATHTEDAPHAPAGPENRPEATKPAKTGKRRANLEVVRDSGGSGGAAARKPDPEAEAAPIALSEDALADHFAEEQQNDWRRVAAWDRWFFWNGDGWAEDREDSRVEPMRSIFRRAVHWPEAAQLTNDSKRRMCRQASIYATVRLAGTDARLRTSPEVWDADPWMLGVPGGVVDLREGKLIEASREQCITMRCSVAPERGTPELWLKMLRHWTGGDDDVIGFLRRFLGYALTGDNREQCMAFFYGPAQAGKGTILRTISGILGSLQGEVNPFKSYHYEAPISTFMESRNDRHTTELAALYGKRLITSEEPSVGAKWDEGKLKWITGGSQITARFVSRDNFSFTMTGKIIVAANHRPRLATTDKAIKRRLHVVPFENPVADEDRDNQLDSKLRAEWPRILHWLIEGCLEWQQSGLGLPERIAASTDTYLESEDTIGAWMEDCCERGSTRAEAKALYESYRKWSETNGEHAWTRRAWANAMLERGFSPSRSTGGIRMLNGLTLKTPDYPPSYDRD